MRTLIHTILLLSAFLISNVFAEIHPWQAQEFTFPSDAELSNPYIDSLQEGQGAYASAVFTSDGGESITVPLFWDGGKNWTVRFSAPSAGHWSYKIVSNDDALNGKSGSFDCVAWTETELQENPTRRGFIQVNQTTPPKGRFFQYADGTPFLWIGDTWWNWSKGNIHFDSFKKLADDRAEKGFTVGQLFFAGRGWGREASILNQDYTMPDLEHLQLIESFVRYANEKGITVWIHAWWGSNQIDRTIGGENLRRWWRYVVHRLQAYNVIWVLAGEYNLYDNGGFDLEFWNDLGRMIKDEDAYDRITSAHPTPPGWDGGKDNPQWSTADVLHNQDWLDYNQSQVGHGKWRNEMIPSVVAQAYQAQPAKPIVVTEPWYEFVKGNPTAEDIRFGAWSAILSGAAGHSYAGGHV
ncbi:DUF4038 domain-containing protein, partial [bacterium]|nr:DUF4038 domain-containing protein [bacterium]